MRDAFFLASGEAPPDSGAGPSAWRAWLLIALLVAIVLRCARAEERNRALGAGDAFRRLPADREGPFNNELWTAMPPL